MHVYSHLGSTAMGMGCKSPPVPSTRRYNVHRLCMYYNIYYANDSKRMAWQDLIVRSKHVAYAVQQKCLSAFSPCFCFVFWLENPLLKPVVISDGLGGTNMSGV